LPTLLYRFTRTALSLGTHSTASSVPAGPPSALARSDVRSRERLPGRF